VRWHVSVGNESRTTVKELVLIPVSAYHLHGTYWNDQAYSYWCFFGTTSLLTIFYLSTKCRITLVQTLLLYACAMFVAAFLEKLYHTIRSAIQVKDVEGTIYAILVIGGCIEWIPALLCLLIARRYCRLPCVWGCLGLVFGAGFLFLGAGYFLGVGILVIASLLICLRLPLWCK